MRLILALLLTLFASSAFAQAPTPICFNSFDPPATNHCQQVDNTNPFPVTGTFSASITGFSSNNNFGSLTATGSSSASTALPGGGGTAVRIANTGTTAVSCTFATGTATAVASNIYINAGSAVVRQVLTYDHIACIDQAGSVSNVVTLEGGNGLGNDSGGGGSGFSGAITMASGAVASGAYAAGALAVGAGVDGWDVTEGTKADAAWTSGAGSVISLLKGIATIMQTPPPLNLNGADTAWTGLTPGTAQTGTIVAANIDQSSIGGTAVVADQCQAHPKLAFTINQTSSSNFITGTSGKKNYICSISWLTSAAANLSVVETSGACTGGTPVADYGSTTAASGPSFAANGGIAFGNGQATVISGAANTNTGYNVCILQNGSATVSGGGTYVQG